MREPDPAIFRYRTPATVIIQVFVTDGIIGDVPRGFRVIFAAVAIRTPLIEIVFVTAIALDVAIQLIGACESADLIRVHGEGLAPAGRFAFPAENGNDRGVAGFVDIDLVGAGPENGKRQVGCIHFKSFVFSEALHANPESSFRQAQLDSVVGKIEKGKASGAREANGRGAEMQFGAGVIIGPEFVSGRQGAVDDRGNPIFGASGLERNRAMGVAETSNARRRIVVIGGSALRKKKSCGQDKRDEGQ
jgi:hypothetical protein